jgi:6-phosphogluconolactonase (cycloisomerase 2 family)
MKNVVSALSLLVLCLCIIVTLAGCGSVSATSTASSTTPTPTPVISGPATPTPTPAPTATPAAHGTFVFSSSRIVDTTGTAAYRLNDDGTLAVVPGSPFPVNGVLAVSGNFLISAENNQVVVFRIDPATGALTTAGSGDVPGVVAVAADGTNVYAAGNLSPAGTGTGIYGFSIGSNGALKPLAGSPYFFAAGCDTCSSPLVLALNGNFLIEGGASFHGIGNFAVYPRMAGGVLGTQQMAQTDETLTSVAVQHPTGRFGYGVSGAELDNFTINAGGTLTKGTAQFLDSQDITVDPSGKYLLLVDSSGEVHVFTIDPTTGETSQIATSESAGNGATAITMDPSGHFVLVAQSAAFTGAADQVTVFTFDATTGAMKKLQSYPLGSQPGVLAVAQTQ